MTNAVTNFKEVNNLGFDVEKTKELIAGLKKDGVDIGIENLSAYIREQGLIVSEHIGRKRNYVSVEPKVYGVDLSTKGEEANELFAQHMKMGKITFLPEKYETKLVRIESNVRTQKTRNAIGYDGKFMLVDSYKKFVEFVEKKKQEYFETRDEIVANWDSIIDRFKDILYKTLDELNAIDKENVFTTVMSKIPSKEVYANSFYMTIGAKAFPVTENLSMFAEDIQEQIKDGLNQETVQTLYDIIGNTLNDAFEATCWIINSVKKEDNSYKPIAKKTLGAVKNASQRIAQKNIFHNPKIEKIRLAIEDLLNYSINPEIMCEEAEIVASMIYVYSKELGVEDSIKLKISPLSEDELLQIFEMVEETSLDDEKDSFVVEEMYKMRA